MRVGLLKQLSPVVAADHSGLTLRLRNASDHCDVLADVVIGHYGSGATLLFAKGLK